jgi:hypothetical protein
MAGSVGAAGPVAWAATAGLTVTGDPYRSGTLPLGAAATLAVAGQPYRSGTVDLTAAATWTVVGFHRAFGLTATAGLAFTGRRVHQLAALTATHSGAGLTATHTAT